MLSGVYIIFQFVLNVFAFQVFATALIGDYIKVYFRNTPYSIFFYPLFPLFSFFIFFANTKVGLKFWKLSLGVIAIICLLTLSMFMSTSILI